MALADHMGAKAPAAKAAQPNQSVQAEEAELDDEQPNVTPEEQDIYERVVYSARALAYNEATNDSIVKALKRQSKQPAKALAEAAILMFGDIDKKSGGKLPEDMIIGSAKGVLDEVIDMAEQTGTMQVDATLANKAMQELYLLLGQKYDFDPAEMQELIQSIDPAEVESMVAQQQQVAEA